MNIHNRMDSNAITWSTARDIVTYYAKPLSYAPTTEHSRAMVRLSSQLLEKHRDLFDGMLSGCKPDQLEYIAQQIFQDDVVNFGRLVTLYTFVGLLAKHYGQEERLTYVLSSFVERRLGAWMSEVGGWSAFLQFFG